VNLIERLRAEHVRNGGQGAYAWKSRELCGKAATEIERLTAQVERMREALEEARLQLEYLDERHPTGTTPAMLGKINAALSR